MFRLGKRSAFKLDRRSDTLLERALAAEVRDARDARLLNGERGDSFLDFGVSLYRHRSGRRGVNAAVHEWVEEPIRKLHNTAFVDATTVYAAEQLMESDRVTAASLFDLATVIRTLVLYDHVAHLESSYVEAERLNQLLGERVFVTLPIEQEKAPIFFLADLFDECQVRVVSKDGTASRRRRLRITRDDGCMATTARTRSKYAADGQ